LTSPALVYCGKIRSIAVRNRQLSATERSGMLPPNTGKHECHLSNQIHYTAARRSEFFRVPGVASLFGWLASSLLTPVMKSAPSSARNARQLGVLQLRYSRWFCDLLCPTLASFLLTGPSVIRSRMLFGRLDFTCHFHEGARLLRVGLSGSSCCEKPHRAALLLLMSAA